MRGRERRGQREEGDEGKGGGREEGVEEGRVETRAQLLSRFPPPLQRLEGFGGEACHEKNGPP